MQAEVYFDFFVTLGSQVLDKSVYALLNSTGYTLLDSVVGLDVSLVGLGDSVDSEYIAIVFHLL